MMLNESSESSEAEADAERMRQDVEVGTEPRGASPYRQAPPRSAHVTSCRHALCAWRAERMRKETPGLRWSKALRLGALELHGPVSWPPPLCHQFGDVTALNIPSKNAKRNEPTYEADGLVCVVTMTRVR